MIRRNVAKGGSGECTLSSGGVLESVLFYYYGIFKNSQWTSW